MNPYLSIVIVIFAIFLDSEVSALKECEKIKKTLRECYESEKLLVFMQSSTQLGNTATFYKSSAGILKIECHSKLGIDMDRLPIVQFKSVDSIELHQCSLSNLTTLNELQMNFGLSGIKSLKIHLTRDNQIFEIDGKLFESFSDLESLEMITNSFVSFKENSFKSLHNIKTLKLQVFDITILPYNVFNPLWKLETLTITNSGRMKAETKALNFTMNSCINLKHFTLNEVRWPIHVFNLLTYNRRLTTVKITNNRIKTLSENFLNGSSEIEEVFLSHNHIKSLPAKIFATQTNLIKLDLNHNEIVFLDEEIFQKNVDLESLNLSHNELNSISRKTFSRLENLLSLNLENNKFTKFNLETNLGPLKSLKLLSLSRNLINRIEGVLKCQDLNHLELEHNDLKRFYVEQFWTISNSKLVINLKENQLESVDFSNLITAEKHDSGLLIDVGDEMICNCHTVQLANFLLRRLNITESAYERIKVTPENVRCVGSKDMSTETVMSVDQDTLTCPLNFPHQELCPSACKCLRRPSDGVLIIECQNITRVPMMPPYQTLTDIKLSKIELRIVGNGIERLPSTKRDPNYNDVTEIYASHNEIRWLTDDNFPDSLEFLDLRFNHLKSVSSEVLVRFATLDFIQLSNNPWKCNISLQLIKFVKSNRDIVKDFNAILCSENQKYFIEVDIDEKCEGRVLIAVAVVIFLVSLVVSFYVYRHNKEAVIEWIFTKEKHHLMERVYDKLKLFDGIVIASDYDEVVGKYIASKLMNKPNQFKVALIIRDWTASDSIPEGILKNLRNSRRVIIVLTKNFKESDWKRWSYYNTRTRIIFVVKGQASCDNIELTNKFSMKFSDPWFWDKLKHAMTNFNEMDIKSRDDVEMQLLDVNNHVQLKADFISSSIAMVFILKCFVLIVNLVLIQSEENFYINKTVQKFRLDYRKFRAKTMNEVDQSFFNVYNELNSSLNQIIEPYIETHLKMLEMCDNLKSGTKKNSSKSFFRFRRICVDGRKLLEDFTLVRQTCLNEMFSSDLTEPSLPELIAKNLFNLVEFQMNKVMNIYNTNKSCVAQFIDNYLPSVEPIVDNINFISNITVGNLSQIFDNASTTSGKAIEPILKGIEMIEFCLNEQRVDCDRKKMQTFLDGRGPTSYIASVAAVKNATKELKQASVNFSEFFIRSHANSKNIGKALGEHFWRWKYSTKECFEQ